MTNLLRRTSGCYAIWVGKTIQHLLCTGHRLQVLVKELGNTAPVFELKRFGQVAAQASFQVRKHRRKPHPSIAMDQFLDRVAQIWKQVQESLVGLGLAVYEGSIKVEDYADSRHRSV